MLPVPAPVTSVLVLKGFVRERGRAIAYVELGMPVAAMIFVPLTQMFIGGMGDYVDSPFGNRFRCDRAADSHSCPAASGGHWVTAGGRLPAQIPEW